MTERSNHFDRPRASRNGSRYAYVEDEYEAPERRRSTDPDLEAQYVEARPSGRRRRSHRDRGSRHPSNAAPPNNRDESTQHIDAPTHPEITIQPASRPQSRVPAEDRIHIEQIYPTDGSSRNQPYIARPVPPERPGLHTRPQSDANLPSQPDSRARPPSRSWSHRRSHSLSPPHTAPSPLPHSYEPSRYTGTRNRSLYPEIPISYGYEEIRLEPRGGYAYASGPDHRSPLVRDSVFHERPEVLRDRRHDQKPRYGRFSDFERAGPQAVVASPLVQQVGTGKKPFHRVRPSPARTWLHGHQESQAVHASELHAGYGGGIDGGGGSNDGSSGGSSGGGGGDGRLEDEGEGYLNLGDDVGNGNKRDLFTMAQFRIRNPQAHLILCIYRSSRRTFETRVVRTHGKDLDDRRLFHHIRYEYSQHLRGWRVVFTFKAMKGVRLLQLGNGVLCEAEENDVLFSPGFMRVFSDPDLYLETGIQNWMMWFQDENKRRKGAKMTLALEMQEGYDPIRITIMVGLVLVLVLALTATWLIEGGDAGYVSGVMSYVLSFVAAVIALTSVWDWFDGGESEKARLDAVLKTRPEEITKLQEMSRRPMVGERNYMNGYPRVPEKENY